MSHPQTFTAAVIEEHEGKARTVFKTLSLDDLPAHDTLVQIDYSGLNYKDGLALSGNRNKVARSLPMVGGIDLAGLHLSPAEVSPREVALDVARVLRERLEHLVGERQGRGPREPRNARAVRDERRLGHEVPGKDDGGGDAPPG
mgnify:CR=1 FL=1